MKKHLLTAAKLSAAYIMTLLILWGLLVLTSMIPNEKIGENMLESAWYFSGRQPFETTESGRLCSTSDNYADAILLNIMWNIKNEDPFISSLDTKYYDGGEQGVNYGFYRTLYGDSPNVDYTRYWHGSVIFLRPLMLVTDIVGIKAAGLGAVLILLAVNIALLIRKKHYHIAAGLAFAMVCVQIWNIGLSLEYIPVFLVCLGICPLFILSARSGDDRLMLLSVISGAMTAFFDFLTVETITILIPLIIVMLIRYDDPEPPKLKENIAFSAKCLLGWGIAYLMTFLVKWTAASAATGENKFITAIFSAEERFVGEAESITGIRLVITSVLANLSVIFGGSERVEAVNVIVGIAVTAAIFAGLLIITGKGRGKSDIIVPLGILGAVPFLRFMVLGNHSYLHEFFTYRALSAAALAMFGIIAVSARKRSIVKRKQKKTG